jgi:hypothetical protein
LADELSMWFLSGLLRWSDASKFRMLFLKHMFFLFFESKRKCFTDRSNQNCSSSNSLPMVASLYLWIRIGYTGTYNFCLLYSIVYRISNIAALISSTFLDMKHWYFISLTRRNQTGW